MPEAGTLSLVVHQDPVPATPCPVLCLRPELSLDVPPQKTTQSPLLKEFIKLILSHLGPGLSLELCWGVPSPVSFPHPTFLVTLVPQPRVGHLVTFSALAPSSQECGFTHTKPFPTLNSPDHQQHYR